MTESRPQSPATPTKAPLQERHELELELAVLEEIYNRQRVRQRDLADAVGASLGMTNAIVKRLSRKGLLTVRKVNNRNVAYAVTPAGIEAIARKSYRYLKRTIKSVVGYRDALEALVVEVKRKGYRSIVVLGQSDLAFVLEHLCAKYGLEYQKQKASAHKPAAADKLGKQFLLYAEHVEPAGADIPGAGNPGTDDGSAYLMRILVSAGT